MIDMCVCVQTIPYAFGIASDLEESSMEVFVRTLNSQRGLRPAVIVCGKRHTATHRYRGAENMIG